MPRKHRDTADSGRTLVLVDDDIDYLQATRALLESEGHKVLSANDGVSALAVLRTEPADVLLLDYFMPGLTGEEVVTELRKSNRSIQIVLQTGYSSERPPREMLKRLDIQGYHDKSDGPDKLLLWADAALKQAAALQEVRRNRQALAYILDATPELHRMQPLAALLPFVLGHVVGLLGASNAFLIAMPEGAAVRETAAADGFRVSGWDASDLVADAGCGRFAPGARLSQLLSEDEMTRLGEAIRLGETLNVAGSTIVPLRAGEATLGMIYLEQPTASAQDLELLQILANQAAVAIQNIRLYEMAAMDPLTGVHARRFFESWIQKELHSAFRNPQPISLLMIDVDHMKEINDTVGHLGGDRALRRIGAALRSAIRESDVAGRYGGDEFAIILPHTNLDGAARVGERILGLLAARLPGSRRGDPRVRCSLGASTLLERSSDRPEVGSALPPVYFQEMAETLINSADAALYSAKGRGGGQLQLGAPVSWPPSA
jgi:two-component system, cell cycle response regulator